MSYDEIKHAEWLLKDHIERSELMSLDGGGWCLSVQFTGGSSRVFYSLESVEDWIDDRQQRLYEIREFAKQMA